MLIFFSALFQYLNLNFGLMKIFKFLPKKAASAKKWFLSRSKLVKGLLGVSFLLVIFVIYKVACSSKSSTPQYSTAQVQKETIIASVSASGNAIASNITNVNTKATGVVSAVYIKEGDSVYKGQNIAQVSLDQAGQQNESAAYASYLSAKNSLDSANTAVYSLESSMFAANQKFINDAVARELATDDPTYIQENDDWLAAQAKYQAQQNTISQAQITLNNAWLTYSQTKSMVTAPASGVISSLSIAPGMTIGLSPSSSTSSTNQKVVSIVNSGKPLLSVNISEIDVPNIKTGQKATVTFDSIPDKTFTGSVVAIDREGSTTSNVTNYPAIISLDSASDQILSNMAATANIITQVKDNVLTVPSAAISQQSGQDVVRILKDGQEQTIPVEVGISSDTNTEIVSGLNEGDTVIVSSVSTNQSETSSFSRGTTFGGGGATRSVFVGR